MTLAVVQYVLGARHLGDVGRHPTNPATAEEKRRALRLTLLWTAVALGALLIPTALLATGCTGLYNQLVHKEMDLTFEDRQSLENGWDQDAAWVPADATGITGTASTDSAVAAILLRAPSVRLEHPAIAWAEGRGVPHTTFTGLWLAHHRDRVAARCWAASGRPR